MSADPFRSQSRGNYAANSSGLSPQSDLGVDAPSGSEQGQSAKNPLSMGLDFLKGLGHSEKKTNRGEHAPRFQIPRPNICNDSDSDGQPPKKRGPKPDSKPALTRRQELNRQAQRYKCPHAAWPETKG